MGLEPHPISPGAPTLHSAPTRPGCTEASMALRLAPHRGMVEPARSPQDSFHELEAADPTHAE